MLSAQIGAVQFHLAFCYVSLFLCKLSPNKNIEKNQYLCRFQQLLSYYNTFLYSSHNSSCFHNIYKISLLYKFVLLVSVKQGDLYGLQFCFCNLNVFSQYIIFRIHHKTRLRSSGEIGCAGQAALHTVKDSPLQAARPVQRYREYGRFPA